MIPVDGKLQRGLRRIPPVMQSHCFVLLAVALVFFSGCSREASSQTKSAQATRKPAVPVTVSTALEKSVPVQLKAIGKVQSFSTVAIKAQVDGQLVGIHFEEGQKVKKGDLLFSIDSRPFEAELRHAEAELAKEKVQLQNARKQSDRYASVVKQGYVSQEQHDQIAVTAAALEASIRAGEAAVETAKLKLSYCTIRSPIEGQTGEIMVHKGNLVKANDSDKPLVVINQVNPIYINFAVPEKNLPELKRLMATGEKLQVTAAIPGYSDYLAKGVVSFFDNAVNHLTGTIQLKAAFENKDRLLWPGQFVNVSLTLMTKNRAVVVPVQAVQTGQQGRYVFVARPDQTVEYRPVSTGAVLDTEILIENGIAAGEVVVTDGQLKLANGSQIKVIDKP